MTIDPTELAAAHFVYHAVASDCIESEIPSHMMLVLAALSLGAHASIEKQPIDSVLAEVRAIIKELYEGQGLHQ